MPRFAIDDYKDRAARLDDSDIDYGAFAADPLPEWALRCLRYMHDVENHTICYLRDLLVTRAHRDPEITTFLTLWSYEELWHGEAIAKVLAAHGEPAGVARVDLTRRQLGRRDALRPVTSMLASGLVRDFTAVHMTWGAVNEWTTQAGYARLASLTGHQVLGELLRQIMKQEGRHIDFYASEAERRLAAARIDRRIDRLPGLAGLGLVTGAVYSSNRSALMKAS